MAPHRRRAALLTLLALAASSCNWTEFDDLQLQTPVRALGRPTDMDSNDFPQFVLPVTDAPDTARLLITGADNVALADYTFKPDGDVATETIANRRFLLGGAPLDSLTVAAYVPSPDGVPRFAGVTADARQPVLVNLDSPQGDFAVTPVGTALPAEAVALAVGDAGGAGQSDIVVAGAKLFVLPDRGAGALAACDLDPSAGAVAVGAGWVVVSQSDAPGKAVVVLPPYENDASSKCATRYEIRAPSASTAFGAAVLVADVDGDGQLEIVVSAPAQPDVHVYRYEDVLAAAQPEGPAPWRTLPLPADPTQASAAFGTALAFGLVEGQRTLLVGDPGAAAGGGVAWIYAALDAPPAPLERPNAEVQGFGTQVGVLPFAGTSGPVDLVWASATAVAPGEAGAVYLHYRITETGPDPRAR